MENGIEVIKLDELGGQSPRAVGVQPHPSSNKDVLIRLQLHPIAIYKSGL